MANRHTYFFYYNGTRYWMFAIGPQVPAMIPGAANIEQAKDGKRYDGIGFFFDDYNVTKEQGEFIVTKRPICPKCESRRIDTINQFCANCGVKIKL